MQKLRLVPDEAESAATEARQVVVVYEDPSAREHAIEFCGQLTGQSAAQREFDFHWCSFEFLCDALQAGGAAEKAAAADLVVFAIRSGGDLPQEIKLWVESWLGKRSEREGAVVGLMQRPSDPCGIACLKEIFLRHAAHRAGMDYLSQAPPTAWRAMPDSLDSFTERAGQMTSVLDQILRTQPPPTPLL